MRKDYPEKVPWVQPGLDCYGDYVKSLRCSGWLGGVADFKTMGGPQSVTATNGKLDQPVVVQWKAVPQLLPTSYCTKVRKDLVEGL